MPTPRLFISHSHHDNALGLRLVADLRARLGEDAVWYDVSGGLRGGEEWWNTIVEEITARDTFMVILSPDAVASDWVKREMAIAYFQHVKQGKRLLPLAYRPCKLSTDWELIQPLPISDPATHPTAYARQLEDLLTALGIAGAALLSDTAHSFPSTPPISATMPPANTTPATSPQSTHSSIPDHEAHLGTTSPATAASPLEVASGFVRAVRGGSQPPRRLVMAGVALLLVIATLGVLLLQHISGSPFANNGTPTSTSTPHSIGPWKVINSPVKVGLNSIAMDSATDGWAVGQDGTILHFTGGQWLSAHSPINVDLLGVTMVSATDGWAVGSGGTILHYTGG